MRTYGNDEEDDGDGGGDDADAFWHHGEYASGFTAHTLHFVGVPKSSEKIMVGGLY